MATKQAKSKKATTIEELGELMASGFARVDARFSEMDALFDIVGKRIVHTDEKVDSLSELIISEFAGVDERFDRIDEELAAIRRHLANLEDRVTALEESLHDVRGYAKEIDWMRDEIAELKIRVAKCEQAA